jgi:RES domain-containing protein
MKSWKIATEEAALDRSGNGAKKEGGHWNSVGTPALYSGATVELCALEKWVHIDEEDPDAKLVLVSIELPDDPALCRRVGVEELPKGWDDVPVSTVAREFGTRFLKNGEQLYMCVPSVIVHEACNFVINPAHAACDEMKLEIVRSFSFDPRMFKR